MRRYFREDDANTFLVKVQPGADPIAVAQQIDDLYGKRHRLVVTTNRALMGRISTLEQQAFTLFDMLALITMFVGFFGMTNTLTMNVLERRRELGMLRAVGMSQEQILRMVLAEAALMGLVGAVMGLVLGAVLARIFMLAMTTMSGYRLAWVFPLEKVVLALLIGLLTALVAALLPALRATRIRILEAIRYE
jgi:putative ABC transport system permease protein